MGLLVAGSAASVAANVAAAEPTMTGRVIDAWPSFSLIAAYELLMRHVRRAAGRRPRRPPDSADRGGCHRQWAGYYARGRAPRRSLAGQEARLAEGRWAQDNRSEDGSLPSGRDIGIQYGRHERWGRLVKRSGLAGELSGFTSG